MARRNKNSPATTVLAWLVGLPVAVGVGYSVFWLGYGIAKALYGAASSEVAFGEFILLGIIGGFTAGASVGGLIAPSGGDDREDGLWQILHWIGFFLAFFAVYYALVWAGSFLVSSDLGCELFTAGGMLTGFATGCVIVVWVANLKEQRDSNKLHNRIRIQIEEEKKNRRLKDMERARAARRQQAREEQQRAAKLRRQQEEKLERIKREADKARRRSQTILRSATQVAADFDAAFREAKRQGVRFSARERSKIDEIRRFLREKLRRSHVERQRVNAEQLDEEMRKESKP